MATKARNKYDADANGNFYIAKTLVSILVEQAFLSYQSNWSLSLIKAEWFISVISAIELDSLYSSYSRGIVQ